MDGGEIGGQGEGYIGGMGVRVTELGVYPHGGLIPYRPPDPPPPVPREYHMDFISNRVPYWGRG